MRFPTRHRFFPCVVLILTLAAAAAAEPQHVENGTEPAEGLVTTRLVEQWRAGGEDDEIFFGNVGRAALDAEGNVMLLDAQLSEVQVYGPDGTHLRTIGREGDGPGEMRNPNDFFVMTDGTVCVLQGFGGRVTKLTSDGTPAGTGSFTPADGSGQFSVMIRGLAQGDGMLLAGIKMTFADGVNRQTSFLSRCDAAGVEQTLLLQKETTIDYSDFVLTEAGIDFVWSRVAVGPDGRIWSAPARNGYEIHAWGADGAEELVITRPYEPVVRDDEQRDIARKIHEGIAANYQVPNPRVEIEKHRPDIGAMWVLADGTLWIQNSRGDAAPPAGTWTVLDVFGPDGRFVRQVALGGDHDPLRDGLHMLPDGRLVVVTGALDAYLSQQAVGGEEGSEDAEPLEIICYTMEM